MRALRPSQPRLRISRISRLCRLVTSRNRRARRAGRGWGDQQGAVERRDWRESRTACCSGVSLEGARIRLAGAASPLAEFVVRLRGAPGGPTQPGALYQLPAVAGFVRKAAMSPAAKLPVSPETCMAAYLVRFR